MDAKQEQTTPQSGHVPAADLPEPVVTRKRRLSSIWLLPLVVALAGGWLVYQSYLDKGPEVTILFESGESIEAGKTTVQYKGVVVGKVKKVFLTTDRKHVAVTAELAKEYENMAVSGSNFWLVKPRVSAAGVSGIETILSGVYIEVLPGKGEPADSFTALKESPVLETHDDDLVVVLTAPRLGSVTPSTPVYYRQVQVGVISEARLSKQADKVIITVRIKKNYAPLVRAGSVFWNVSGIGVDLGLFGGKIKTESLSTILAGGVAFATPEGDAMGPPAARGTIFPLHADPLDEWLAWAPKINIKPDGI